MKKRIVITGMGAITPIGNDVETFGKMQKMVLVALILLNLLILKNSK